MKMEQIKEIASAVLYEGYLLYPYRHSAIKNRQRWTFGVVYPREYSEVNGGIEPWYMRTECLVAGQDDALLDVSVSFLHLLTRRAVPSVPTGSLMRNVSKPERTQDNGRLLLASQLELWEEGIEREVSALHLPLHELLVHPRSLEIAFPGASFVEPEQVKQGGVIERKLCALTGTVVIAAERVPVKSTTDLYRVSVQIENTTTVADTEQERRDAILLQSFISTHTILHVHEGNFISLMEPPETLEEAVRSCRNLRTWPVLVGEKDERDTMLSSPIILYDYPQIAPESPGMLFDGTEIDEILALRILTLSDEEKEELRQGDERVRAMLEQIETLSPEQFLRLHGAIRETRPLEVAGGEGGYPGEDYPPQASVCIAGRAAQVGDKVRLHPGVRADAFDLLLAGKVARIEAIQQDFENRCYLVVTVDDDPGREQWDERVLPGHRFFFFPEEVELLEVSG